MYNYYGSNTLWVPLNNGRVQRTTWSGLAPLRNQYLPSVLPWGLDASMFRAIPIAERVMVRLNVDFFNVLNHPGNIDLVDLRRSENGGRAQSIRAGLQPSADSSGNSPRQLQ